MKKIELIIIAIGIFVVFMSGFYWPKRNAINQLKTYNVECHADSVIIGYQFKVNTDEGEKSGIVWTDKRHPKYDKDHPLLVKRNANDGEAIIIERLAIPAQADLMTAIKIPKENPTLSGFLVWLEKENK